MFSTENGRKKGFQLLLILFSILFLLKNDLNIQANEIWVKADKLEKKAPGESSHLRVESIDTTLIRSYAPILYFHPDEGKFCCFPSCADDAYPRAKDGKTGKYKYPKTLDSNTPCYFEALYTSNGFKIKYWFWYNYNDYPTGPGFLGSHPGDWEYLEVQFEKGQPVRYVFSNHTGARVLNFDQIKKKNHQVEVWVGKGSHANYESPDPKKIWSVFGFPDKVADGGQSWNTGNNLVDIKNTIFSKDNYLGDWGDGKKIFGPLSRIEN